MIEISNLFKFYGKRRVVGPLSASIQAGEVIGLLGLNGAGKTTTLRVLSCDLLPSAGTVTIDGVNVVHEPEKVRTMTGYLPDSPPLYDEMRVSKFLAFAAQLRGVPAADVTRLVGEAIQATGLSDVAKDPIASLSHGYRQRVGIAQAIVHKPKLVVLDEPSSGLDPVQIKEMRQLVRSLGGNHTVIVSSHNLPEISEMCDRLLVIREGQVVAAGTEAELVSELAAGEQLELTLRRKAGQAEPAVLDWLKTLPGVVAAAATKPKEVGDGILSAELKTEGDVRAALSAAVVGAGHDLLGLGRSERELESVFGRLAQAKESEAA